MAFDPVIAFFIALNIISTLFLLPLPTNYFILMVYSKREYKKTITSKSPKIPNNVEWPKVAIQLPIYNEGKLVLQLLNAVAQVKYPHGRCTIQILDDSTDETTHYIDLWLKEHTTLSHTVQLVRNTKNRHFKAGALQYGLTLLKDVEYVAVFDADFIPPSDFLQKLIPYFFVHPKLAAVQAMWKHKNRDKNLLTRGIATGIDTHFYIEKMGRQALHAFLQFNGSGGIWARRIIEQIGGWKPRTLAEDLDLSYRAQLAGYQILFVPHVKVMQTIPDTFSSFLIQQYRWAQGYAQNLIIFFKEIWGTKRLSVTQKLQSTLHLSSYFLSAVVFINIVSLLVLVWTNTINVFYQPPLYPWTLIPSILVSIASVLAFLAYFSGVMRGGRKSFITALIDVALFSIISGSMLIPTFISCLAGIVKRNHPFERTPKDHEILKRNKSWMRTFLWTFPDLTFVTILFLTIPLLIKNSLLWGFIPLFIVIALGTLIRIVTHIRRPLPKKRTKMRS